MIVIFPLKGQRKKKKKVQYEKEAAKEATEILKMERQELKKKLEAQDQHRKKKKTEVDMREKEFIAADNKKERQEEE